MELNLTTVTAEEIIRPFDEFRIAKMLDCRNVNRNQEVSVAYAARSPRSQKISPYWPVLPDVSVRATWLMIRCRITTSTWMCLATSGRNSLTKFPIGADARPVA